MRLRPVTSVNPFPYPLIARTSIVLELERMWASMRSCAMTLKGKVALVTGASSGIGRATAIVLAERGADVACNGRDVARLEETVAEVRARGRGSADPSARALALVADVADAGQVRAVVRTAQDCFGRIDILVNNAGHIVSGLVEQHS